MHSEQLAFSTEQGALTLEKQVAKFESSRQPFSESHKAAIRLARLKYKATRARKYKEAEELRITQLKAEQQRVADQASAALTSSKFEEDAMKIVARATEHNGNLSVADWQVALKYFHYVNDIAQKGAKIETQLAACLANANELAAWHDQLKKSIDEETAHLQVVSMQGVDA